MGYGNLQGTFNIGIVQTDVQAIVQGITGYYGRTLTDLDNNLAGYLACNGIGAASLLQSILNQLGNMGGSNTGNYLSGGSYGVLYDGTSVVSYLNWIYGTGCNIQGYLYDSSSGQSVATLLAGIRSLLQQFSFDGSGCLRVASGA